MSGVKEFSAAFAPTVADSPYSRASKSIDWQAGFDDYPTWRGNDSPDYLSGFIAADKAEQLRDEDREDERAERLAERWGWGVE